MELTLEQLEKETCSSYGGNNCVLHGCMFSCQLADAKARAKKGGEYAYKGQGYCHKCGWEINHCKCGWN